MNGTSTISFTRVAIVDVTRPGHELEEPGALIHHARLMIDAGYELRMAEGFGRIATSRLKAGAVLSFGPDNGPWQRVVLDKNHTRGAIWLRYNPAQFAPVEPETPSVGDVLRRMGLLHPTSQP